MIKAIIIDDEIHCEILTTLLKEHCPEVLILSVCNCASDALQAIKVYEPQLVFLDIEMAEINAFQLLDKIIHFRFELILTSYRDENAVDAIHYGAADYLLKPISVINLRKAVKKTVERLEVAMQQHQLSEVLQKVQEKLNLIEKVALPTIEGLQMVAVKAIIYCMSNSNYTNFTLKDRQKLHVCRTLKEVESMLEGYPFIRVHHSYLVNLNEVKKYIKGEGGSLVMSDNTNISVSRSHKEQLLKKLNREKY